MVAEQFLSTVCNISPGYGAIFSGFVSLDLLPYQRSLFLLLRRLVIGEDAIVFMMDYSKDTLLPQGQLR